MEQKIIKTGNSLAITIPSAMVKLLGIKAGDKVKVIKKPEKNLMICLFSGIKQLPLIENFLNNKKNEK